MAQTGLRVEAADVSGRHVDMMHLSCCCCVQARVHPKTESPIVATLMSGAIVAVLAFFVPLTVLADLVSMGWAPTTSTIS
jgi:hypothetical protein